MAPPTYGDLGKSARDVFSKGYHFGLLKLDVKTKTETGVEFGTGVFSNQDSGVVAGHLESKYKFKDYGVTFTERWNTDNLIVTDLTFADKLLQGLSIGYNCTFSPQTGTKTGKLKTTYKHDNVSATADFDLSLSGAPLIHSTAVVGYQGWLAGYQTSFDAQKSKIVKNNFALGFTAKDFGVHTSVDNGREYNGSIYHKIRPGLEGAVNIAWNSSNNATQFGLGAKYDLDNDASVRGKVNSQMQMGIGYQQKIHEGVVVSLSANIDGKSFNSGGHKVGFALDFEP